MKIALIQEKQNKLYCFKDKSLKFTEQEIYELQWEMIDQNLEMLEKAAQEHTDIALTSEAINFPGQPIRSVVSSKEVVEKTQDILMKKCSEIARKGQMNLVIGMFRVKNDGNLYNSAVVFDRQGKIIFDYDKNFLAGEEKSYLTPGGSLPIWESEFGKIGIGICWDMQFPEISRIYARKEVDLILCPTWGWESLYGRSRAYENGIYVASAMAVPAEKKIEGKRVPSEVIGPDGMILVQGNICEKEIVYCEVRDIKNCEKYRKLRIDDLYLWEQRCYNLEKSALTNLNGTNLMV